MGEKLISFGLAIEAAKQGKCVARIGWNGKGMFAYIQTHPDGAVHQGTPFGDSYPLRDTWMLKTAQGDIATWAPSGSDSLAEDWIILTRNKEWGNE